MNAECLLWLAQVAEGVLDLDDYDTLAFRVRGDGRKYIASLRTENWMVDAKSQDVWQAFLFARCPKRLCSRCSSVKTPPRHHTNAAASCAGQQQ
jgi:Complex I intermediate-associated protein 30 (CIA30)